MINKKNIITYLKVLKISLKWITQCLHHSKIKKETQNIFRVQIKSIYSSISKKRWKKILDLEDQQLQENSNLQLEHKTAFLITKIKLIIYLAKFIAIKYFQEIKSLRKRNLISIKIILSHQIIWFLKVIVQIRISIYK
jgi:hypothetical protein